MEQQGYWNLFWQTGLPEIWLLSRMEERPEAVPALSGEEESGTRV